MGKHKYLIHPTLLIKHIKLNLDFCCVGIYHWQENKPCFVKRKFEKEHVHKAELDHWFISILL